MKTIKIIALMKNDLFNLLNVPIKKTWWYESNYGNAVKMKNWNIFNLNLVNIGSSSAKFAFDYSEYKINAANWANQPQNLASDYEVIKNYYHFLCGNGIVIITLICPFGGMVVDYDKDFYDKYHYFLLPNSVKYFNEETLERVEKIIENPLLTVPKTSIKSVIRKLCGIDKPKYPSAKIDAQNRINSWKKQFSIESFADPISGENMKAIEFNTNLLCEMVEFCKERSLKPILGIMPTTKTLKDHIPSDFMQKAFYDMVEEVKERTGVQVLDYYHSSKFENKELYLDSFLMNEKGATVFTKQVLTDLKN